MKSILNKLGNKYISYIYEYGIFLRAVINTTKNLKEKRDPC